MTVFDGQTEVRIGSIPIAEGPLHLSLPLGEAAYVTTRRGTVDAVDIRTRAVDQLLKGGVYGPMDYNELTGEVYVPDEKRSRLAVLAPIFPGSPLPREPDRVIQTDAPPLSVAITNDGSLGFIAMGGGRVVMLDLLRRQIAYTLNVGGTPHFIITGLYPPTRRILPPKASTQRATTQGTLMSTLPVITVSTLVLLFLVLLLLLLARCRPLRRAGWPKRKGTFRVIGKQHYRIKSSCDTH